MKDPVQRAVDRLLAEQKRRLEEEATILVRMGYGLDELTVVTHPDGSCEVSPISALKE